jgi:hypothetical protein
MFTVSKYDIPRYWWAYAGNVEERAGECPEGPNYFDRQQDAIEHAANLQTLRLNSDYINLKNRATPLMLALLRIRSLWNSKLRANLATYFAALKAAEIAVANIPPVEIEYMPDDIPVLGDRLPIGTRVYEFDSYSLQLTVSTVESENIAYYSFHPEGVAATYELSNGRSVKSDLQSGYSNVTYYLNGSIAKGVMQDAVTARIEELQELLR